MIPIEIVLVILGIASLVISYFITEKVNHKAISNKVREGSNSDLINVNEDDIRSKVDELLSSLTEDIIEKTEDKLSLISNEKIMAVSDYSDQILEKIDQNHQEVVFLYNMLNEKDKEIKDLLKQIETVKSKVQTENTEFITIPNHNMNTVDKDWVKNETSKQDVFKEENNLVTNDNLEENGQNNNELILTYYNQGMSVLNIAKKLNLGQGEVKLVIDLFQGEVK